MKRKRLAAGVATDLTDRYVILSHSMNNVFLSLEDQVRRVPLNGCRCAAYQTEPNLFSFSILPT